MQSSKEVVRSLFVACCDTSIVLDGIEESLDEIALEGAKSQARLTLRVDFGGMTALMRAVGTLLRHTTPFSSRRRTEVIRRWTGLTCRSNHQRGCFDQS